VVDKFPEDISVETIFYENGKVVKEKYLLGNYVLEIEYYDNGSKKLERYSINDLTIITSDYKDKPAMTLYDEEEEIICQAWYNKGLYRGFRFINGADFTTTSNIYDVPDDILRKMRISKT
jgi:hypothetical protein